MENKIYIIFNPIAGAGKSAATIDPLKRYLKNIRGVNYEIVKTHSRGHAIKIAREIERNKSNIIVVVGGDGTINEVVNGLLQERNSSSEPVIFGVVNTGSGAGFAQSLGLPDDIETQLNIIIGGKYTNLDAGVVTYTNNEGQLQDRFFISECQIGFGGHIVSRVGMKLKRFGGKLAFGISSVAEIFKYKASYMNISIDNKSLEYKNLMGVVVANGRYCGGGMQLTPTARLNDGFLDILDIPEMNIFKRLFAFSKIYSGDHIKIPLFQLRQAHKIKIDSEVPVWIESDGELLGKTPCSIQILPSAIRVFSPQYKPLQ
jgi:diacylglycerol kinase (ATP)